MTLKSIITFQAITFLLILLFTDYVNYFCPTISYLIYNQWHELLPCPSNKKRKYSWRYVLMAKFPCCNSNHQQQNLDQCIVIIPHSSCKKDVRTHPPMIMLVFWKLLENRVFLWECCSVIFVKDAYLSESLLRVYI